MEAVWLELVFAACGAASALAVAAVLAWIHVRFRFSIVAWSWWLVIPVGAMLCGAISGSGYLLAARVLGRRPRAVVGLSACLTSAAGYVAVYYFEYRGLSVDGVSLSSVIPFSTFLDAVIRGSTVGIGVRGTLRTGSLGVGGYPLAALQLAGFIAGGFGASVLARAGLACDRCRRVLSPATAMAYGPAAVEAYPKVHQLVQQGRGAAALSFIQRLTGPESDVRLTADVATCRHCAREHFSIALERFVLVAVGYVPIGQATPPTERWTPVSGYTAAGYVETVVAISPRH